MPSLSQVACRYNPEAVPSGDGFVPPKGWFKKVAGQAQVEAGEPASKVFGKIVNRAEPVVNSSLSAITRSFC